MKSTDLRIVIMLIAAAVLVSCKDHMMADGLAYGSIVAVTISASESADVGDSLNVRVKAVVDKHIFKMQYPNFPDTVPSMAVDTMESLYVWIYQEPYSSSDSAGFSFRVPDSAIFTPVVDGGSYTFTFRADAVGAGKWWIVAAATYLDREWQAVPERDGHDGYLDVWESRVRVTIRSGK